ncbi:MAG: hmuV [Burkholderiaceae bacterium]|nr:hmuV [Burkholderiaceae bacterium]
MNTLLQCQQLSIRVGQKPLIAPFDWQVNVGERWAVLGQNGVGKTALLHALLGVDGRCRSNIYLSGLPLSELSVQAQAQQRVWVPQRYDEPFTITVAQAVHSVAPDVSAAYVLKQLDVFGLREHAQAWVHQLSGGERQRLTWAMAAVRVTDATRLCLLDEPFSAQDIVWQSWLLQYLREQKHALIATVHDLNQVRAFATHVLLLAEGKVLAQGEVVDVMRSEVLSEAFGVSLHIDDAGWVFV